MFSSVETLAFGNHIIFYNIVSRLNSKELLGLRTVCKQWQNAILHELDKRKDLVANITVDTLMKNDPSCFNNEDSCRQLLRVVKVGADNSDGLDRETEVPEKFKKIMDIINGFVAEMTFFSGVPFPSTSIQTFWNSWDFPQLKKASFEAVSEDVAADSIPLAKRPNIKTLKVKLMSESDSKEAVFLEKLFSATPNLLELRIESCRIPDFAALSTQSLKKIFFKAPLHQGLHPHSQIDTMVTMFNSLFERYSETLEEIVLGLRVWSESVLKFSKQMKKLSKLDADVPFQLELSPAQLPSLRILKVVNLAESNFVNASALPLVDELEIREAAGELEMMDTIRLCPNVSRLRICTVQPEVTSSLLIEALKMECSLKHLETFISVDIKEQNNFEEAKKRIILHQMDVLEVLQECGLETLVANFHMTLSPTSQVEGTWGAALVERLLSLGEKMKKIKVRGRKKPFSAELGTYFREEISRRRLPISVDWDGDEYFGETQQVGIDNRSGGFIMVVVRAKENVVKM